jgi:beta-lactamase regulating signal transducer with metallopeptidase domain
MSVLTAASLLIEASIAMAIAAAGAAIWCAFEPAHGAARRRRIWAAVAITPLIAAVLGALRLAVALRPALPAAIEVESTGNVTLAMLVWAVVAAALGARMVVRQVALTAWASSLPVHDSRIVRRMRRIAGGVGLRSLRVVSGVRGAMPLCWGFLRPTVLLPENAGDWPEDLFRSVALHECSHLAQGDNRLAPLIDLICALFWFHPGAWMAFRRLHADSERACDERVVARGIAPYRYAMQLLALARGTNTRGRVPLTAFLGRGELEERVSALMLISRATPPDARRRRHLASVLIALAATLAMSPPVRLALHPRGSYAPAAIPGAHPGSFGTTLFGGR